MHRSFLPFNNVTNVLNLNALVADEFNPWLLIWQRYAGKMLPCSAQALLRLSLVLLCAWSHHAQGFKQTRGKTMTMMIAPEFCATFLSPKRTHGVESPQKILFKRSSTRRFPIQSARAQKTCTIQCILILIHDLKDKLSFKQFN